jgi:hypothetical protein
LIDALKHIHPKQTVLLRGRHGIGKSAIAYQMAEAWGIDKVIERRISQLSEGDMIGLPDKHATKVFADDKVRVTKFLPTDWFLEAELRPCVIFLDEINRGTPETIQATFQFVEKGELNGRKIHPESRIIAAINFSKEYQVTPMDMAFVDRFWVADVEPDKDDWIAWAHGKGKIDEDIIDFIKQCNADHFEIMPEKAAKMAPTEITPSRRSWERLNTHVTWKSPSGERLLDNPKSDTFYNVCRGFVGPDASRALAMFLENRSENITADDILDRMEANTERVKRLCKKHPERVMGLIDKIKHHLTSNNVTLTDDQAKNIYRFMKAIPPEMGPAVWEMVCSTGSTQNAAIVHKYSAKYILKLFQAHYTADQLQVTTIKPEEDGEDALKSI